ncbi:MAG: phosphatidylserine decarboxylase, partial [Acidobacteriota bacterium]|nr:phosphatidylserine decarboxylase [Acidobacteriota bacterium]
FVESMGVDMSESVRSEAEFTSFNDFICREIDLSRRPVDRDPAVCVAPADGRVLAFGCVGEQDTFAIKRHQFGLGELVGDAALARRYAGGAMLISRLYLADYHHFHFPASGIAGSPRRVEGKYLAVSPYARRRIVPWLTENTRVLTELASDAFGRILMIEVGAFTVGSIQQRFPPATRVGKGDPKGFFELGGSVVVLLFERGRIRLDPDLCDFTRVGVETFVRLGESIGRAPARGRSRALEFSGKIG